MELKLKNQKVNLKKVVRGNNLDIKTYENKFVMWDYIKKNDLMQDYIHWLKKDITIFAYEIFKDKDGDPLKLTAYQDLIGNLSIQYDFDPHDIYRYFLYRSGNQIGKSALLCILAIYHALYGNNVNIIMISKTRDQSQFLLAEIRYFLNNSKFSDTWQESVGETANMTQLTFQREGGKVFNRIICAPAGEGTLGYPVHYLYMDEADFYENAKSLFSKVLLPRTYKTKGQIILFSNPNASISRSSSLLWDLWNSKMFELKFWFKFLDAPWGTQKEYEKYKDGCNSFEWMSTLDGEFPIDSGSYFTQKEIEDMIQRDWNNHLPVIDKPVFIGLDLAKMKDQTVLALGVLNPNKDNPKKADLEIRYFREYRLKTDYDKIIADLGKIVEHYKTHHKGVAAIALDVSGVGRAVSDFAKAAGIKVTDVKFSLENKSRMYGNFKMLAEQRRIRIVKNDTCEQQLGDLVFKTTPMGYLSIQHEKEAMRDDYPDAICALIDVSIIPSKVPVTITEVGRTPVQPQGHKHSTQSDAEQFRSQEVLRNRERMMSGNKYNAYDEIDSFQGGF